MPFFLFVSVKESHIFEGFDLPKRLTTVFLRVTLLILRPLLLLNDNIKPPKNAIKIAFSATTFVLHTVRSILSPKIELLKKPANFYQFSRKNVLDLFNKIS